MNKRILVIAALIIVGANSYAMTMKQILSFIHLYDREETFLTDTPQNLAKSILRHDDEFRLSLEEKSALTSRTYSTEGRLRFLAKLLKEELIRKGQLLRDIVDIMGNNILHALLTKKGSSSYNKIAVLSAVVIVQNAAGDDAATLFAQQNLKGNIPLDLIKRGYLPISNPVTEYPG